MVRKLALAVALALGSASFTVSGLGLGELKTRSQLNQAFDADIDLLSVKANEIDGVRVRLAPPEAFARAGVDRSFVLSQLRFMPELTPAGRTVIRVTSDYPIREPFLNFLIEVNWPRGRLLREYTVLLDPPTTTRRPAPRVVAPAASQPQIGRPAPAAVRPAPSQTPLTEYGPVRRNETLWGIAKQVRPSGVSMNQMMMSLFAANPQAFTGNNVNNLRRGQILRVPAREEILGLSRAQANALFRAQQDSWQAERRAASTEAPRAEAPVADAAAPLSAEATDRLRIASPEPEVAQEAGAVETDVKRQPTVEALNEQILLAREEAESSRQEAELLRARVEGLRAQLEDMQRLLTLKDDQLAQIQSSVAAAEEPLRAVPEAPAVVEPAVEPAVVDTPPFPIEPAVALDQAQAPAVFVDPQTGILIDDMTAEILIEDAITEPAVAKAPVIDESAVAREPVEPPLPTDQVPAEGVVIAEPAAGVDEPVVPSADQPVWMARLQDLIKVKPDASVLMGLAAGILLLGGLIGILVGRRGRKRKAAMAFGKPEAAAAKAAAPAKVAADDEAASILSELSSQDLDGLREDAEDVDPISEADVYIAYGRYQQAEQLLQQAIDKDPQRLALPHKLLEVYYATRNTAAFVTLAGKMMGDGRDQADPTAWERAKEMGRELDDKNVMFTAVAGAAVAAATTTAVRPVETAPGNDGNLELDDLELSELARDLKEDTEPELTEPAGDASEDLNLDLHEAVDQFSAQVDRESVATQDLESLDLDLPTVEAVNPEAVEQEVISLDELALASKLSEDLDVSDSHILDEDGLGEDSVLKIDTELEVSELASELEQLHELRASSDSAVHALDPTQPDSPLDLDHAFEQAAAQEDELEGFALYDGDATGVAAEDEVATKLDLARAYVEMGDSDGARSILEEVKGEGNDNQKAEAGKLLLELAS